MFASQFILAHLIPFHRILPDTQVQWKTLGLKCSRCPWFRSFFSLPVSKCSQLAPVMAFKIQQQQQHTNTSVQLAFVAPAAAQLWRTTNRKRARSQKCRRLQLVSITTIKAGFFLSSTLVLVALHSRQSSNMDFGGSNSITGSTAGWPSQKPGVCVRETRGRERSLCIVRQLATHHWQHTAKVLVWLYLVV